MYEPWYGFREKPFSLTPDPKYLYLSPRHAEAFAHLEFGRRERGGFIVITGDVGTGKTTLARYFLSKLGPETRTAVVLYPALTAAELLRTTLDDLHVKPEGDSLKSLVDALHRFLLESRAASRDVVLLIDEAQDLSAEVLEQVRLLSNLETDTEKLIQIILMGQSELRDLLARHELRQLAQRVTARYHLGPLDAAETGAYVRHRIAVAGGEGKVGFTNDALAAVHARSGGVPRLVNLICDRALLAGYVKGSRTITRVMVAEAADEVETAPTARASRWRHGLVGTALTLALAVAAFALAPRLARAPAEVAGTPASLTNGGPATARPSPLAQRARRRGPRPRLRRRARRPCPLPLRPPAHPRPRSRRSSAPPTRRPRSSGLRRASNARGQPMLSRAPLRTHLDQLRALDLPAVLEVFHPSRTATCYLALVGLGKSAAVVSFSAGDDETVPLSQLEAFWTRNAIVAWPEEPGGPGLAAWARERLAGARLRRGLAARGGEAVPGGRGARQRRPSRAAHADGSLRAVRLRPSQPRRGGSAVSLILDALKKVEREEAAGKPGVVVVGSVPWGEPSRSPRRSLLALGAVLALGLVALGTWWWLRPAGSGASSAATAPPARPTGSPATVAATASAALPSTGTGRLPAAEPSPVAVSPSAALTPPPIALAPAPVHPRPVAPAAGSGPAAALERPPAAATPRIPPGPAASSGGAVTLPPAAAGRPAAPDRPTPMPELRLSAISVRDGQPVAIVNDRIVREGDDFDGVRVVHIGEVEVEVEFRGRRHVLRF